MKVDIVKQVYNKLLKENKEDTPKALGWHDIHSQMLRFQVLCDIGDIKGKWILDWGCGFGDLYKYLNGYAEYAGYDNNSKMITRAKKRYKNVCFMSKLPAKTDSYDYIFASGVYNIEEADWEKHLLSDVGYMWDMVKIGVAINFTSALTTGRKTRGIKYSNPFAVGILLSAFTKRLVIRHDYKSNDFTVYLYKEQFPKKKRLRKSKKK